jgi:hypothetical protein
MEHKGLLVFAYLGDDVICNQPQTFADLIYWLWGKKEDFVKGKAL